MPRIYPKTHHSPHKRTKIAYMYKSGVSLGDVASQEEVTKHAIFGIVCRYEHQRSAKSNPRSGRPTILTERDKNHILRIVDQDPFIAANRLLEECGARCHRSTLTRWLKKRGIQHYLASRRPFLSEAAAAARRNFAEKYVDEDASFWYTWIFSDECSVARGDGERRKWAFSKYVSYTLRLWIAFLAEFRARDLRKRTYSLRRSRRGIRRCFLVHSPSIGRQI
jgi:transposase